MEAVRQALVDAKEEPAEILAETDIEGRLGTYKRDIKNGKVVFEAGVSPLYFHQVLKLNKPATLEAVNFEDAEYQGNLRVRRQHNVRSSTLSVNHMGPNTSTTHMTGASHIVQMVEKIHHRPVDVRVDGRQYDWRLGRKRERPLAKTEFPKGLPIERRTKEQWTFPCPTDPLFRYDFAIVQYPTQVDRATEYEIEVEIRDLKVAFALKGGVRELVDRFTAAIVRLLLPNSTPGRWYHIHPTNELDVLVDAPPHAINSTAALPSVTTGTSTTSTASTATATTATATTAIVTTATTTTTPLESKNGAALLDKQLAQMTALRGSILTEAPATWMPRAKHLMQKMMADWTTLEATAKVKKMIATNNIAQPTDSQSGSEEEETKAVPVTNSNNPKRKQSTAVPTAEEDEQLPAHKRIKTTTTSTTNGTVVPSSAKPTSTSTNTVAATSAVATAGETRETEKTISEKRQAEMIPLRPSALIARSPASAAGTTAVSPPIPPRPPPRPNANGGEAPLSTLSLNSPLDDVMRGKSRATAASHDRNKRANTHRSYSSSSPSLSPQRRRVSNATVTAATASTMTTTGGPPFARRKRKPAYSNATTVPAEVDTDNASMSPSSMSSGSPLTRSVPSSSASSSSSGDDDGDRPSPRPKHEKKQKTTPEPSDDRDVAPQILMQRSSRKSAHIAPETLSADVQARQAAWLQSNMPCMRFLEKHAEVDRLQTQLRVAQVELIECKKLAVAAISASDHDDAKFNLGTLLREDQRPAVGGNGQLQLQTYKAAVKTSLPDLIMAFARGINYEFEDISVAEAHKKLLEWQKAVRENANKREVRRLVRRYESHKDPNSAHSQSIRLAGAARPKTSAKPGRPLAPAHTSGGGSGGGNGGGRDATTTTSRDATTTTSRATTVRSRHPSSSSSSSRMASHGMFDSTSLPSYDASSMPAFAHAGIFSANPNSYHASPSAPLPPLGSYIPYTAQTASATAPTTTAPPILISNGGQTGTFAYDPSFMTNSIHAFPNPTAATSTPVRLSPPRHSNAGNTSTTSPILVRPPSLRNSPPPAAALFRSVPTNTLPTLPPTLATSSTTATITSTNAVAAAVAAAAAAKAASPNRKFEDDFGGLAD